VTNLYKENQWKAWKRFKEQWIFLQNIHALESSKILRWKLVKIHSIQKINPRENCWKNSTISLRVIHESQETRGNYTLTTIYQTLGEHNFMQILFWIVFVNFYCFFNTYRVRLFKIGSVGSQMNWLIRKKPCSLEDLSCVWYCMVPLCKNSESFSWSSSSSS